MKRSVWKSLLLVCLSQYCTRTVAAPTVQFFDNPFQQGRGGEFKAVIERSGIPGLPDGTRFSTFCLEKNESIDFGATYYVQLSTITVGGNPTGNGLVYNELDPRTAWLYNEFRNRTLAGYDFSGPQRKHSAGQLQNAIWFLENEIANLTPHSLAQDFVALAEASDWHTRNTIGNVRVMNLYEDVKLNGFRQDQLCLINVVPAPGAVLLAGLGTTLIGYLRRLTHV